MTRLVLGTASFGMPYGVTPHDTPRAQPSEADVHAMLTEAATAGVRRLDTAAAYGDAEARLGAWAATAPVGVLTKLRPNLFEDTYGPEVPPIVLREAEASLARLRVHQLACYWLHTPRYAFRRDVVAALRLVQHTGLAVRVGVSVYQPDEAEAAMEQGLDLQVPLNVCDQRFVNVCRRAQGAGLRVYGRSPFAQGVLLLTPDEVPARLGHARDAVATFRGLCERVGLAPHAAALGWALSRPHVDGVIFGVNSLDELRADLAVWREPPNVDWDVFTHAFDAVEAIVNPSLWAQRTVA